MILELLDLGLSKEQIVTIYIEQLNFIRSEAEFAVAIELGETIGDVIVVDEFGNEGPPDES